MAIPFQAIKAVMAQVQELKLLAWKGGYISGKGDRAKAWHMRPVLNEKIVDIENRLYHLVSESKKL